jgi:hypothetical protein
MVLYESVNFFGHFELRKGVVKKSRFWGQNVH